jgi:hypothetical protein
VCAADQREREVLDMKGRFAWRSRRKLAIAVGAVVALALVVPTAWAVFDDVPPSNPHYADVNAIQGAGITAGCAPGLYCPADFVRRDQMATFMRTGYGRSALSSTNEIEITADTVDLGSLTITVGGAAGQTQFVKLDAAVTAYIDDEAGCPCETAFLIYSEELDAQVSTFHYLLNSEIGPSGFGDASGAATAVVQVPTATTQTFRVLAFRNDPTPLTGEVAGYASLSAITAPFGSTGTNVLGTATVSGDRATGRGSADRLP